MLNAGNTVEISGLFRYPVKSLRGEALSSADIFQGGIEGDRQWAIFKPDRCALTQRENPRMSLVSASYDAGALTLSAEGFGSIQAHASELRHDNSSFKIWKDFSRGAIASPEVGEWLAECLKSEVKLTLVKTQTDSPRTFADPQRFAVSANYFSDAAPLLVCTEASLAAVNIACKASGLDTIDMRHFRPNIVIKGIDAFAEHEYSMMTQANIRSEHDAPAGIRLVDHCQRCPMITVDPDRGEFLDKAYPLKILMSLNTMPGKSKAPAFGVNAVLSPGDSKILLSTGQRLCIS